MGGPPNFMQRCFGNGTTPTTGVTFAASPRVLGRTSPGGGPGEELTVDATLILAALNLGRAAIAGDVVIAAGSNAAVIQPNVVSNAKLAQAPAVTLKGNPTAGIANETDLTLDGTLQFVGGTQLGRSAITGDVGVPSGSNASTIGNNKVTDAMVRQSAALSVIGRSPNSVGNVADISGTTIGQVLQIAAGPVVAFATPPVPGSNTVPLSSLVNATAQYDVIARKSAGAGSWEDSTRLQANIPGLELANTFSTTQTINEPGITFLPLALQVTDNGALGPFCRFEQITASPAANDQIATFQFLGRDSAGNQQNYGDQRCIITDPTSGSEDAVLRWQVAIAGSNGIRMQLGAGLFSTGAAGGDKGVDSINFITHYSNGNLVVDANSLLRRIVFTFATLPSPIGIRGAEAYITDGAAVPVWNAAAAGAGTTNTPVISDNTVWRNG